MREWQHIVVVRAIVIGLGIYCGGQACCVEHTAGSEVGACSSELVKPLVS